MHPKETQYNFFVDTDFEKRLFGGPPWSQFVPKTLSAQFVREQRKPDSTLVGWRFTFSGRNQCDTGKNDRYDIFVGLEKDSLSIDITEPKEVWPTLPTAQGGNPDNRNMIDTTIVTLTINGEPVENQQVTITALMVLADSAGHNHDEAGAQETPPIDSLGTLRHLGPNVNGANNTITAQTDTNGVIRLSYTASAFGGFIELTAQTVLQGDTLVAKDTLLVKVPNLIPLPDNTPYLKVGGRCNHYGPRLAADPTHANCRNPDNNHYAPLGVILSTQLIAFAYQDSFPNEYVLRINDISLPYGGLFDINGTWKPPHNSHRTGEDVDVGTELPGIREGVPVRTPRRGTPWPSTVLGRNRIFEDICDDNGVTADIHDPGTIEEHYHLDF